VVGGRGRASPRDDKQPKTKEGGGINIGTRSRIREFRGGKTNKRLACGKKEITLLGFGKPQ